MKSIKVILNSVFFLLLAIFVFSSCEKKDDYDYNSIEPIIEAINGQITGLVQTQSVEFSVFPRGGSKFEWEAINASIDSINEATNKAKVYFENDGEVTITVVETTLGGKKSPPKSVTFMVGEFCPFVIDNFIGVFNCDEEGYGVYTVNFTKDPAFPNRVYNDNFWDYAAAGQLIYYEFDGSLNQNITVPLQPFIFGDDSEGTVVGTGKYDGCAHTMTVTYTVVYDETPYTTKHVFRKP